MKMKLKIILLLLSLTVSIFTIACNQKSDTNSLSEQLINNPRWITAPSGLRMRANPDTKSLRLFLIPEKTRVNLIKEAKDEITIGDKKGKWSFVQWKERKGWVFGGFLSEKVPEKKK
jgi:hypothetical protein